jgi:DsbC/DsbD-like thiol-disulfide interchange protein
MARSRIEALLTLVLEVADGWHINANPATLDFLIPTRFRLDQTPGIRLVAVQYPKGKTFRLPALKQSIAVYEKTVRIPFRLAVEPGVEAGTRRITGNLSVQACDDRTCLAPSEIPVEFSLEIRER